MVANQRLQRIAPAGHGGLLAAQLVGARAQCILFGAAGLQRLAQRGNLALQPLQRLRRGLKAAAAPLRSARPGFPARPRAWPISASSRSASRSSAARLSSPCAVWLRALPARVSRCMAWRRLLSSCRSAAKTSSAAAARLLLARLHLLAKGLGLAGRRLQKAALLRRAPRQCRPTASASAPAPRRPRRCASPAR